MKAFVTIQHPGHVHFFRPAIDELRDDGHEVFVFAREKDVVVDLLHAYDIDHEVLAGAAGSLPGLAAVQFEYEARLLNRARRHQPDVITAVGGVAAAHVGAVLDVRSVVFYDTEHAALISRLAFPLANAVYTPDCYGRDLGPKQHRYPGYHELAYLHPDRFTPDPTALETVRVDPEDPYVLLRVVSWGASHDVGNGGLDSVESAVERLEGAGVEVLLSNESRLPPALEDRRIAAPPHRIHHLLSYADAVIGEGATMAAESAVLGTPAVYVNSLALGYLDELESRYGLVFGFSGPDRHSRGLAKATHLLETGDSPNWDRRRARLLEEKVDTTDVVVRSLTEPARPPSITA